jgi:hypothetical protein
MRSGAGGMRARLTAAGIAFSPPVGPERPARLADGTAVG